MPNAIRQRVSSQPAPSGTAACRRYEKRADDDGWQLVWRDDPGAPPVLLRPAEDARR
jgi:hypothetical protein